MESFIDLRKLNRAETLKLRKQVVQLKLKGYKGAEIESALGIRQNRISEIWRLYLDDGVRGLEPGAPGRKPGEKCLLSAVAEREIRQVMIWNTPDRLNMPYSLWTRQVASDFIRREYGLRLSLRCMTNYFKKWGFTCKTPIRLASGSRSAEFIRFVDEEFPAIVRRAAAEDVGIYWYGESWAEKDYPHKGPGSKRVKMEQVATARGTARFMFFEGRMTQERFITLIDRLIRYADRKVFLIARNGKPCRGEKVAAWLKGREDRIEVFYHPDA